MAATLKVSTPAGTQSYPITGTLAIGRAPENDVVLESVQVSRRHASITAGERGLVFVDLGSANGSRVNGHEVEPRVPVTVRAGDLIAIADCSLELSDEVLPEGVAATAVLQRPGGQTIVAPGPGQGGAGPHATVVVRLTPRLEIVTRTETRDVALEGDEITLGRDPASQIVVDADVVSRRHLVLRRSGSSYVAEDLGSTNGIRFGGVRVASRTLNDGDILDIAGEVHLRFHFDQVIPGRPVEGELALSDSRAMTIGRADGCDLRLSHPTISLFHARISPGEGGTRMVEDLGSTNGTYVNGVPLARGERRAAAPGDIIQVGPVRLHVSAAGVRSEDQSRNIQLTAVRLNQRVSERLNLLQDISLVVEPQEFVAVVGVSGSGKSTLLAALSGLRPATDGDVLLNGTSLYHHYQAFRTSLGYVPQDDILHRELPVARALAYAAELRLPDDTPAIERERRVQSVIAVLGLQARQDTPVGRLSGGQRKRVSIGAELLTEPGLFFLDEATSGLDPGTESQLMKLLRSLADEGHTVLLVTHATKNVMLCDQVVFLAHRGNLAYFGPPDQALAYFGVEDFDGIYQKLESEKSPEEWAANFRASPQYQEYVVGRLEGQTGVPAASRGGGARVSTRPAPLPEGRTSSALRQLKVLSMRYLDITRRDRVNFALLFLLAPTLALIDLVAWPGDVLNRKSGDGSTAMTMLFLSALIPFLVGSLSFVREIVKEAAVYARERAVALSIWPYLGSKIAIGSLFALYHAAALFIVKYLVIDLGGLSTADLAAVYVTLVLMVVSGVLWALLISTVTSREEQAMMLIIGLIVLQVVFSGGLVPLADMGVVGSVVGGLSSTAWGFKALTAAVRLDLTGCTGDLAACNLPGIQGLPSEPERKLAFDGINDQFDGIFGADVLLCWAAMVALIGALSVALYVLQRRKDRL